MGIANPNAAKNRETSGILVFAKAPTPGHCKTRLARGVGTIRAARLYRAMLETVVARLAAVDASAVTLICAPSTRHPLFARLAHRYGVNRIRQSRGDLGQRMIHAMRWGSRRYRRVLLVGSDQPDFETSMICDATRRLGQDGDAWLAPTRDGGYWTIGLSRYEPRVFRGPRWSTARVAAHTRTRIRALALRREEAPPRRDIDTVRDWQQTDRNIRRPLSRRALMPGAMAGSSTG